MERLGDMMEVIDALICQQLEVRKLELEEEAYKHEGVMIKLIDALLINTGKHGVLVITYLRSSYITKSHKFKIALYEKRPFVEKPSAHSYYALNSFFQLVEKDIKIFEKTLGKKFYRIKTSELEEIRRYYFGLLYCEAKVFFQTILGEKVQQKKDIHIFFGEEMGEIEQVGIV